MLAIGLVAGGPSGALHQSTKPLAANHFWITSATWSEFLSIIAMWVLPLMPMSGRSIRSTLPPALLIVSA